MITRGLCYVVEPLMSREYQLCQRTQEMTKANAELTYFNSPMVGRELRMVELKKEIDRLCRQFGQPTRYGYDTD